MLTIAWAFFMAIDKSDDAPNEVQLRLQQFKKNAPENPKAEATGNPVQLKFLNSTRYKNIALGRYLEKFSLIKKLERDLHMAGVKTPVDRFILTNLIIPTALGGVLGFLFIKPPLLAAGPIMFGIAWGILITKKKGRFGKIVTQLPDALNLITSSLKAGHSFQSALSIVVSELPDPLSGEFGHVLGDINWGLPLKDALLKLVHNVDGLPDMQMLVTCLLVQKETGGNLAEVLDKLSYTIRERFKLKGQINALTGQSRLTGYVLGCAPTGLFVFLFLFMNDYIKPLYTQDFGKLLLVVAIVMQLIGFFVMKKIVDIRV